MPLLLSVCYLEIKSWFAKCQINTAVHMTADCMHSLVYMGQISPQLHLQSRSPISRGFRRFKSCPHAHIQHIWEFPTQSCCISEIWPQWWWGLNLSLGFCSRSPAVPNTRFFFPSFQGVHLRREKSSAMSYLTAFTHSLTSQLNINLF